MENGDKRGRGEGATLTIAVCNNQSVKSLANREMLYYVCNGH